jgi:hypothetical protein
MSGKMIPKTVVFCSGHLFQPVDFKQNIKLIFHGTLSANAVTNTPGARQTGRPGRILKNQKVKNHDPEREQPAIQT